MSGAKSITILHVTDIHDSFDNLDSLYVQLMKEGVKVDCILVSGDITTMPTEIGHSSDADLSKYHQSVVQVLNALYKICPRVTYIPGNHDPLKFFSKHEATSIADSIVNVHKAGSRISDGLVVAGFGGSLPGYKLGEQVWNGFPYALKEDFERDINSFLTSALSNKIENILPDDVLVLMTHVGPDSLPTSTDYTSPTAPITCGSVELRKWLGTPEVQDRVVFNIHGHTHAGVGHNKMGRATISNPGAMQNGRFGVYKLSCVGGKWEVVSIHLRILERV